MKYERRQNIVAKVAKGKLKIYSWRKFLSKQNSIACFHLWLWKILRHFLYIKATKSRKVISFRFHLQKKWTKWLSVNFSRWISGKLFDGVFIRVFWRCNQTETTSWLLSTFIFLLAYRTPFQVPLNTIIMPSIAIKEVRVLCALPSVDY